MRETMEDRLKFITQSLSQIKAQTQALESQIRVQERKSRTKRLIENGALAEQYLNRKQMPPAEFEQFLKRLVEIDEVKKIIEEPAKGDSRQLVGSVNDA